MDTTLARPNDLIRLQLICSINHARRQRERRDSWDGHDRVVLFDVPDHVPGEGTLMRRHRMLGWIKELQMRERVDGPFIVDVTHAPVGWFDRSVISFSGAEHGTYAAYKLGCRCHECMAYATRHGGGRAR